MKKEKYSKCSLKPLQTKKWSCFYLPKNPPFLPVLWQTTRLKPSNMLQLPGLILSYLTLPFISNRVRSPIFSVSFFLMIIFQMIYTIIINPVLHLSPLLPSWIIPLWLSEFLLCLSLSIANLLFCDPTTYKNFLIYTRFLDPVLSSLFFSFANIITT